MPLEPRAPPGRLISILAPAWGASVGVVAEVNGGTIFQFSPPRGGRLLVPVCRVERDISILAPAWGASSPAVPSVLYVLFQFSPPRGGRPADEVHMGLSVHISILAPAWGASERAGAYLVEGVISILAPAWGASGRGWDDLAILEIFQFSPPRGGRRDKALLDTLKEKFQFSPPRGGRQEHGARRGRGLGHFNSRPRVGGVSIFIQMQAAVYVHNRRNKYYK